MHPLSAIARLAVPNLIVFLAQMLMATVDGIVAARLGSGALAAVALVLPFQMLLGQTANGAYGSAVAGMIARATGAANPAAVRAIGWHALATAMLFGLLFSVGGVVYGPALYSLAGGRGEALELAMLYGAPIFLASCGVWLSGALAGIARGQGQMWLPALSLLLSAACHSVLSPQLAGYFGISGIGISWAVSFWLGVILLAAGVYRGRLLSGFAQVRWAFSYVPGILRLALPSIGSTLLSNLCIVLAVRYAAAYGQDVLIGFGIAARLEYVLLPFAFGIGVSLIPLAGQARGAGDHASARKLALTGVLACGVLLGVAGTAFALAPGMWLRWFDIPSASLSIATLYLNLLGPFYLFLGFGISAYFAAQAFGQLLPIISSTALRAVILSAGGWLVYQLSPDPRYLFWIIALGMVVHGLCNLAAVNAMSRPPRAESDGLAPTPARP